MRCIGNHAEIINSIQLALSGETVSRLSRLENASFDARYSPLTDDNDEVVGVIGVATDITENRKAQKALAGKRGTLSGTLRKRERHHLYA